MVKETNRLFRVEKMVGEGGMGKVYKAYDVELQRVVALKIMSEETTTSSAARFQREAQTMAKLKHPNIVKLYNFGLQQGKLYLTMELINGSCLNDYLRQKSCSFAKKIIILIKVVNAVHHAHENGVVHRDLKPENIMMDGDEPKVMDFGLAKVQDGRDLSRTNETVGTIAYASPEQLRGQRIDRRSDLYSLGVILYELLTNRLPFRGGVNAMMMQIQKKPPIPPHKYNEKVPKPLSLICLKCLEKDPRHRYENAEELASDLQRFLNGESVVAQRRWISFLGARYSLSTLTIFGGYALVGVAIMAVVMMPYISRQNAKNKTTKQDSQKIVQVTLEQSKSLLAPFQNSKHYDSLKKICDLFARKDFRIVSIDHDEGVYYFLCNTFASKARIYGLLNSCSCRLVDYNKKKSFMDRFLQKNNISECLVLDVKLDEATWRILSNGEMLNMSGNASHKQDVPFIFEWQPH